MIPPWSRPTRPSRNSRRTAPLAIFVAVITLLQIVEGSRCAVHAQSRERAMPSSIVVEYDIRGKTFRVPERYLGGWQATKRPEPIKASFFDVAFWLSDGAPSPVRGISLNTYWPKEAGRPTSGDDDFVVSAFHVEYLPTELAQKVVLPSARLQNTLTSLIRPSRQESVDGLTCYISTHPNVHSVACAPQSSYEFDVLLAANWDKRHWPGGRPPNPSWQLDLYSKKDGLWIWVRFPEVALRRWSDVVCRTLLLVRSWQFPPERGDSDCPRRRVAQRL
jgi:hypothetical protein